jgi:hypothetical protein
MPAGRSGGPPTPGRQHTPLWRTFLTEQRALLRELGEQLLPQAIHHARDQELTWNQIGELLGTSAATAARRYRNKP